MNNQEAQDMMADVEQFLFYKMCNPGELDEFQATLVWMHAETKEILARWHKITKLCELSEAMYQTANRHPGGAACMTYEDREEYNELKAEYDKLRYGIDRKRV